MPRKERLSGSNPHNSIDLGFRKFSDFSPIPQKYRKKKSNTQIWLSEDHSFFHTFDSKSGSMKTVTEHLLALADAGNAAFYGPPRAGRRPRPDAGLPHSAAAPTRTHAARNPRSGRIPDATAPPLLRRKQPARHPAGTHPPDRRGTSTPSNASCPTSTTGRPATSRPAA